MSMASFGGLPDYENDIPCVNVSRAARFRMVFCCILSLLVSGDYSTYYILQPVI
jgi:hypothetical protein